jgi:hypothetical protein
MRSSLSHAWQAAYVSAVLEADPEKALTLITEAQQAIEQRLMESPTLDGTERQAIKAAWKALAMPKITRTRRVHPSAAGKSLS